MSLDRKYDSHAKILRDTLSQLVSLDLRLLEAKTPKGRDLYRRLVQPAPLRTRHYHYYRWETMVPEQFRTSMDS